MTSGAEPGDVTPLLCALAAPLAVLLADGLLRRRRWPLPLRALLDETAHLATAQLLMTAVNPDRRPPFRLGALFGAVLIDADHLPRTLRPGRRRRYPGRPALHSLAAIAGLAAAARLLPDMPLQVALGAAWGLATHVLRDAATGGVPLGWPLTGRRITLPYTVYLGVLLGAEPRIIRCLAGQRHQSWHQA